MRRILYSFVFILITLSVHAQVIINEISYNPPESGSDSLEFIELYNAGVTDVDLAGWHFLAGVDDTFPSVILAPGEYFVTAVNAAAMFNVFHLNVHQWTAGALNNSGEQIILADAANNVIDSVTYDDADPWPLGADGMGPSLELKEAELDNNNGSNWQDSGAGTGVIINGSEVSGTPGAENSGGGTGGGPSVIVNVVDFAFDPPNIVVERGDSVRWVNSTGTPHNVNGSQATYAGNPDDFYSGPPAAGPWQFDFEFNNSGLNYYHCDAHTATMRGSVAVYDPDGYTEFPLEHIRLTDGVNGQHIFVGVPTIVTGVVHGVNYQPSGYSFFVINENNIGINVFSFDPGPYEVNEGDELRISGVISQFNGLLEILPDQIEILSQDNPLNIARLIFEVTENDEGSYLYASLLELDSVSNIGPTGYTLYTNNEHTSNIQIRVDADAGIQHEIEEFFPGQWLEVWGYGTQFDPSFPYTSGYQILADEVYIIVDAINSLESTAFDLFPNPAKTEIYLSGEMEILKVELFSLDGKKQLDEKANSNTFRIDLSNLQTGLYIIKAVTRDGIWTSKLMKNQ